jgi:hypothetical protein
MKVAHDELQTTVTSFMEKDAEIKKLFDMFENTLKAVSDENTEVKEKLAVAQKENKTMKEAIQSYEKDLEEAREQLIQASKVMEEFQHFKKAQIQLRASNITESNMTRKSEPVMAQARPSAPKFKVPIKTHRSAYASYDHRLEDQEDIDRIDEEEDQDDSVSVVQHKPKTKSRRANDERDSQLHHSSDLAYLRESNILLKQQNESLKLQTQLIAEKSKREKDDLGKVGWNHSRL